MNNDDKMLQMKLTKSEWLELHNLIMTREDELHNVYDGYSKKEKRLFGSIKAKFLKSFGENIKR